MSDASKGASFSLARRRNTYMMFRVSAVLLAVCLLAMILVWLARENEDFFLPEEASLTNYIHDANANILRLNQILRPIGSREEADAATYRIAEIAMRNAEAFRCVPLREFRRNEAYELLQQVQDKEDREIRAQPFRELLREYERLKGNRFYGSKSLEYVLNSYFLVRAHGRLWFAWLPTTRLRIACRQYPEPFQFCGKGERVCLLSGKHLHDAFCLINEPNNIGLTLLALDALRTTRNRSAYESPDPIFPSYHSIRGDRSMFSNCMCDKYCFRKDFCNKRTASSHGSKWPDYNPLSICRLSKTEAAKLPNLLATKTNYGYMHFILSLSAPFKSKYMIISYIIHCKYPDCLDFADTLREYGEGGGSSPQG